MIQKTESLDVFVHLTPDATTVHDLNDISLRKNIRLIQRSVAVGIDLNAPPPLIELGISSALAIATYLRDQGNAVGLIVEGFFSMIQACRKIEPLKPISDIISTLLNSAGTHPYGGSISLIGLYVPSLTV